MVIRQAWQVREQRTAVVSRRDWKRRWKPEKLGQREISIAND